MKKAEKFESWWSVRLPEELKSNSSNSYYLIVHMYKKKTLPVYGGKEYEEYYINTECRYDDILIEIDYLNKNSYRVYDNCQGVYVDYKTLSGARSAAHRFILNYLRTVLKTDDITLSYFYTYPNRTVYKGPKYNH